LKRRVAITGIGLVSALGNGTEATWNGLLAGKSGIAPITHFDTADFTVKIAGEVKGFDPQTWIDKKEIKKMDPFIQFAVAASQFAMQSSRLKITPAIASRVGVHIGSGIGGFSTIEREHTELIRGGPRRISPFFIPLPSSIWRLDMYLFDLEPRDQTRPPAPHALPVHMPLATRSESSPGEKPMP